MLLHRTAWCKAAVVLPDTRMYFIEAHTTLLQLRRVQLAEV
jgi:hypothetical protein